MSREPAARERRGGSWVARIVDLFGFFKEHRAWAVLIATINLVGIVYGFYYYGAQFDVTPVALWWLVPDSPLAVLWAQLALAAYWLLPAPRAPWPAPDAPARVRALARARAGLDALAFVGNVQVGFWTCYVLLAYEPAFHTLDFLQGEGPLHLNTILWLGHAGMAALAMIFVKGLRETRERAPRVAWGAMLVAAAYYLVNDVVDYFGPDHVGRGCGLRPYTVPCIDAQEPILAAVTFGLTLASLGALVWLTRPRAS